MTKVDYLKLHFQLEKVSLLHFSTASQLHSISWRLRRKLCKAD